MFLTAPVREVGLMWAYLQWPQRIERKIHPTLIAAFKIIVPGFVFVSGTRSTDHRTRQAAVLGLVVVVSFAVFSLSMEVFNLKFAVSFFGFLVAGLAADCLMTPRPAFTREEGQNPNGKLTDDHPLR